MPSEAWSLDLEAWTSKPFDAALTDRDVPSVQRDKILGCCHGDPLAVLLDGLNAAVLAANKRPQNPGDAE